MYSSYTLTAPELIYYVSPRGGISVQVQGEYICSTSSCRECAATSDVTSAFFPVPDHITSTTGLGGNLRLLLPVIVLCPVLSVDKRREVVDKLTPIHPCW